TMFSRDWSSDVCSSDLEDAVLPHDVQDCFAVSGQPNEILVEEAEILLQAFRGIPLRIDRDEDEIHPFGLVAKRLLDDGEVAQRQIGRASCRERRQGTAR